MGQAEPTKEATILSKSEEILRLLDEFQERLDNRFSRSIRDEAKAGEKPIAQNVLDEILENLDYAEGHLARIISFVSSDVLPKIN